MGRGGEGRAGLSRVEYCTVAEERVRKGSVGYERVK